MKKIQYLNVFIISFLILSCSQSEPIALEDIITNPSVENLIKVDDQGRLDFSRKALLEKPEGYVERPPRGRGDNNRGKRGKGSSFKRR